MKIMHFPLTRITIGFVLGILLTHYLVFNFQIVFFLLWLSLITFVVFYFLSKKINNTPLYFAIATYFVSFFIGANTLLIHTESFQKSNYIHLANVFEKPHLIDLTLREKLKSSTFNIRYIALVNHLDNSNTSGRIIVNIHKDSLNNELEIGSRLRIKGTLYKNNPPLNPNQFDYSKYLEKKQIYAQLYVDPHEIYVSKKTKDIWYYASNFRTKIITNLKKNNFNPAELNVAIALIMGQQQDISPEIIRDYQYAGAVHILSVSGLHIGFILLFVTFILKPIPNTKKYSFLKLVIILLSLSLFGLIAGLAPSVIRSVTMFSFVAIGMYLRRSVNIYHTLVVSILLILLFQPYFLFDVGFQLSYIALFFIIWLQPLLTSIWIPQNKILKYIWEILTVSFAAQIGTLPLSIYYFHQFAGLFFITNIIIIPYLTFIMVLGVFVMLLAAVDYIPLFLSKTLEWNIFMMNKIINWIASIEQFIIRDISFNYYLLMSSYLLIVAIVIWFKKPTFTKLMIVLIASLFLQISFVKVQWSVKSQNEWIVFNAKKNTLITERNGKSVTLFANDSLQKHSSKNTALTSYLVGSFSYLKTKKNLQNVVYFEGKKILILDSLAICPKNINPDILLLTQSPKINLERVVQHTKPKLIIADGSNYKTLQKLWKQTCYKNKIPFHATSEKGFYKLN